MEETRILNYRQGQKQYLGAHHLSNNHLSNQNEELTVLAQALLVPLIIPENTAVENEEMETHVFWIKQIGQD